MDGPVLGGFKIIADFRAGQDNGFIKTLRSFETFNIMALKFYGIY